MKLVWKVEVNGRPKIGDEPIGIVIHGDVPPDTQPGTTLAQVVCALAHSLSQHTQELHEITALRIAVGQPEKPTPTAP